MAGARPYGTILTCPHEAETRARRLIEFGVSDRQPGAKQSGNQGFTRTGRDVLAIKADDRVRSAGIYRVKERSSDHAVYCNPISYIA
jgi:hypothetical protein